MHVDSELFIKRASSAPQVLFGVLAVLTLLSIWAGVALNFIYLAGLPLVLLVIYWTVMDIRTIYFFLMACIPLSTEIVLPNGFGTDLPDEALIVGLFLVSIPLAIYNLRRISSQFILHPISLMLLLHFSWILLCTLNSKLLLISVKYAVSKSWYLVVFYCLTGYFIYQKEQYRKLFWWVFWAVGCHAVRVVAMRG